MNPIPQFTLGDKVYAIRNQSVSSCVVCGLCSGKGSVQLTQDNTRSVRCPDCYGNGSKNVFSKEKYVVVEPFPYTVGLVRTEIRTKNNVGGRLSIVEYMLEETGIGSGTIWRDNQLFSTIEAANKACENLNKE